MNAVPSISLLLAVVLIYIPRGVVGRAQSKQPEGYDNATPRMQIGKLSGLGVWCFSISTPNIWGFNRAAGRTILRSAAQKTPDT